MKLINATFALDPTEPEDYQVIAEMRASMRFRWNGQIFEPLSMRSARKGITVTAKAVDE